MFKTHEKCEKWGKKSILMFVRRHL
jgi:hypothetical protein